VIGCDQQELGVRRRDGLQAPACAEQTGERRGVRGDDVVGAAFLISPRVDARRVDRNERKISCGAPVESRAPIQVLPLLSEHTSVLHDSSFP
jgi:hypothetical protein